MMPDAPTPVDPAAETGKWEVQLLHANGSWYNTTTEDDELIQFASKKEADDDLADHIDAMTDAGMDFDRADYRVAQAG